jgi:Protein of unknown function (DUF1116)
VNEANQRALARIAAVRPQWTAVRDARSAIGLEGRVLLHAGPPLQGKSSEPARLPPPMLNAAVLSCMHEGWAAGEREAQSMLAAGAVRLEPSFTRSVAIPLAAMVSPQTTLAEISDGARRYFAFLGTGAGPQQRFGSRDPAILERLAFREDVLSKGFAELLDTPVDLLAIARAAIREGDDLHNRLSSATTILHAVLSTRKAESEPAHAALRTVAEAPLYFLNLWMPACQLMLLAAQGESGASLVTRLCANGEEIGIQVAGQPGEWFTTPASPVRGPFMKGAPENPRFGPATGDSGVIDAFGLGGQGLRHAPSLRAAFSQFIEADDDARARSVLAAQHPILEIPFGLDAAAVARSGRSPLLSTGMVSADGRGLLGRGICAVPVQPFADALRGPASRRSKP